MGHGNAFGPMAWTGVEDVIEALSEWSLEKSARGREMHERTQGKSMKSGD